MNRVALWSFRSFSLWLPGAVSFVVLSVALLVLTGWAADVEVLKKLRPDFVSMNPVTALGFVGAAVALALHGYRVEPRRIAGAEVLALLVLSLGFFRLMSDVMDWGWAPDGWLFGDKLKQDRNGLGNRMSPNAAMCFIGLGCGLLLMNKTTRGGRRPTEMFALLIGAVSLLAMLGYLYQVPWLYGVASFTPMALHTAVLFHLMAAGLFCARREEGWMAALVGNSPGGTLVRRVMPVLVPGLVLLGWLRLAGERRGFFAAETGTTLYTVVTITTVSGLIWWSARSLHRAEKTRLRLEGELERFFTLAPDMLCIAGADGYFKRVNPSFGKALGYTMQEMLSRPFIDFVHPEDRDRTRDEAQGLSNGQVSDSFENRYLCKDGSWRWFWWKAQFLAQEKKIYATARDVTDQKQAETEIRQLNQSLNARAAQLDATNQELEAFSYSVSHDLRAPLRGISGFAQALEEHSGRVLDDTARSYLQRVRRASDRMGALIDDLLKLSRLTRAGMNLEEVDVSALVDKICRQLQQREPGRLMTWEIEPGIVLHGDAPLLRVLLENLLENAWKFTSKNPQPKIGVGTVQSVDGEGLVCFVRDNGVGFDMRYAGKLFGAFQRLHSMAEFPGTGIGLATVQRVVRRHGGKVWAEAVPDEGSTFYFTV